MAISIFNYEKSKIQFVIELAEKCLDEQYMGTYYLDSDWENGPQTMIVFHDPENETEAIGIVKNFVHAYKQRNALEPQLIELQKQKYYKNQERLKLLEMRDESPINMADDGEIRITPNKKNVYNSKYHREMFHRYRAELQPIYLKLGKTFLQAETLEQASMFIMMYLHIASLYEGGITRGYLTFVSHVEGFFSRLRLEGFTIDMRSDFEGKWLALSENGKVIVSDKMEAVLDEWKSKWLQIANDMKANYSYEEFDDRKMLGLDEQFDAFYSAISQMDNRFHNRLKNRKELKDFILSDNMIIYRNIINLFYLILPLFEQSMIMKQFYCFCTVKYIEENYPKELLLDW